MTSDARNASGLARFYRGIGTHGWGPSRYFTFSVRSLALRHWLAAQLPARSAAILSIGCGTGELEQHLAASRHAVVGLDISRQMLRRARRNGLERLVAADARFLPFAGARFDAVIFPESIGHLALPETLAEALRVLKPGGRLLITTYARSIAVHARYRKQSLEEIGQALAAAGFRVEERRFLEAKRSVVAEVSSEEEASLLYLAARKARPATAGRRAGSAAADGTGSGHARAARR
jgi:ubiquinone/menaquinone biosynthesis C-methylase UbiE